MLTPLQRKREFMGRQAKVHVQSIVKDHEIIISKRLGEIIIASDLLGRIRFRDDHIIRDWKADAAGKYSIDIDRLNEYIDAKLE